MKVNANALSDWLVTHGTNQSSLGALIRLYSHILRDAGIQIDRAFMGTLMIHPQAAAYAYFYEVASDTLRALEISHDDYQAIEAKKGTPMSHMLETGTPLRARLAQGEDHGMVDLTSLMQDGYTDYLALPIRIGDSVKAGMAWATRKPSGFSDDDINALSQSHATFSVVSFIYVQSQIQGVC